MPRTDRTILAAAALVMSFALAGCESSDLIDKLQDLVPFGNNKKPLPGERRAVFPDGVPGVPQGVPPELIKGNQVPPDAGPPPLPPQATAVPQSERPRAKKKVHAKAAPPAQPVVPPTRSTTTVTTDRSAWPAAPPQSTWPTGPAQPAWPTTPPQTVGAPPK